MPSWTKPANLRHLKGGFCSTKRSTLIKIQSFRYIFGTREMHSYIYEFNTYPTTIISPISLIWHAADGVRDNRSIWLRCHPSAFTRVYETLQKAAAEVSSDGVTIRDLRSHVNTFELYGPQSSQVLAGAFRLAKSNGKAQRIVGNSLIPVYS